MMTTQTITETAAPAMKTHSQKRTSSPSSISSHNLIFMGNWASKLSMFLNIVVTSSIVFELPSHDTFDESWRQNGQCYTTHELGGWSMDTSTLCCLVLCTTSAIAMGQWYFRKDQFNENLLLRIPKMAEANISHGFGHFFVYLMGGSIPRVRPWSLEPADIGYTLVLLTFIPAVLRSTMPSLSMTNAMMIGVFLTLFQGAIDIEPHFQFSFTQAVILLFLNTEILSMNEEDKLSNPWTYLITSSYTLPLFPLMWLETTSCSNFLGALGGHGIYDMYLGMVTLAMAFIVPSLEPPRNKTASATKKES